MLGAPPDAAFRGTLLKESPARFRFRRFQQRIVALEGTKLNWYKESGCGSSIVYKGFVDLAANACEVEATGGSQFTLKPAGGRWTSGEFTGAESGRCFVFDAKDSEHSVGQWVDAIRSAILVAGSGARPAPQATGGGAAAAARLPDSSDVFEDLFRQACHESADLISRDELSMAMGLLQAQPGLGGMVADLLRNADANKDGVLTRAEWDKYASYLTSYSDDVRAKMAAIIAKADLRSIGPTLAATRAKLPAAWVRTPAEAPGHFMYEHRDLRIRVATLEEALAVSQNKTATNGPSSAQAGGEVMQVVKLPPGFKIIPSKARPGENVFHDPVTNIAFATTDEAWQAYNLQQENLKQVPAARHMALNKSATKRLTATPSISVAGRADFFGGSFSQSKAPQPAAKAGVPQMAVAKFVDPYFPPTDKSLGVPKPGRSFLTPEQRAQTKWIRLPEIARLNGNVASEDEVVLWEDIEPSSITQGSVGNCWLISSIAALAEFPDAVRHLFLTQSFARDGKYVVRLYDMSTASWEEVTVDDYVPCMLQDDYSQIPSYFNEKGERYLKAEDVKNPDGSSKVPKKWLPHFAKSTGHQIWAMILEKAVAKFVGAYAWIAGGSESYALMALTGFPIVYCFNRPAADAAETVARQGVWEWCGAQYISRDNTGTDIEKIPNTPATQPDAEIWERLCGYDTQNYIMTASITKFKTPATKDGHIRPDGLVMGHAYSLVSCRKERAGGQEVRLMLLRNPHGAGVKQKNGVASTEWNGDWCDTSALWDRHPEVARQVGFQPINDGLFWIAWSDFAKIFDKFFVLPRSQSEPRAGLAFQRRQEIRSDTCLGLKAMAGTDPDVKADLARLSCLFDPFAQIPSFVEDGTRETRLRWDATKPGRLQGWLDLNKETGNQGGYDMILAKIKELGLESALGPEGCMAAPQ